MSQFNNVSPKTVKEISRLLAHHGLKLNKLQRIEGNKFAVLAVDGKFNKVSYLFNGKLQFPKTDNAEYYFGLQVKPMWDIPQYKVMER